MNQKQSKNSGKRDIYYVNKILDKKIEHGRVKYLINWQGYDDRLDRDEISAEASVSTKLYVLAPTHGNPWSA